MMKTLLTTVVLTLAVSLLHAAESGIEDAWAKEELTPDQRTAIVERSQNEPFAEIAPVLLEVCAVNRALLPLMLLVTMTCHTQGQTSIQKLETLANHLRLIDASKDQLHIQDGQPLGKAASRVLALRALF